MSENYPAMEYESSSMSDVMKYYYSLQEDEITEDNSLMSVVNLIDSLPEDYQPPLTHLIEQDALPEHWLYDAHQPMAMEKLALLPLMYLSPLLEESDYPLTDLKQWNSDVITGLHMVISPTHSRRCLKMDLDIKHNQCQSSLVCPHRVIERFVKRDLLLPDFSNGAYTRNPQRAYMIAVDKLDIGVEHAILDPNATDWLRKLYDLQHRTWLNSRWPTSNDTA